MKVVNKRIIKILVIALMLIEACSLFLTYKSFNNKEVYLDEVNLQETIEKSEMLAILVEQNDGTYKEQNTWPTSNYKYNTEKSGCMDIDGNKLDNVISYDSENKKAVIETSNTSFCYLYFDLDTFTAQELLNIAPANLSTDLQGGLYRYQGTAEAVNNNYVCFGYSDAETDCDFTNATNTNLYAYRIIGITEEGNLKLIKKEALNMAYHAAGGAVTWANSDLYINLNSTEFYSNKIYVPNDTWKSKIASKDWNYGFIDYGSADKTAAEMYALESTLSTVNNNIGLMYMHDYYYAYQREGLNCSGSGDVALCAKSWLYLTEGEYLMANCYDGYAWYIQSQMSIKDMTDNAPIRPVFYLNVDTPLSGVGTLESPYIIS